MAKKIGLKIRTKSIYPAKDAILKAIDAEGNAARVKSVVSLEKEDGCYPLFIDEVKDENLYGVIKEFDGDMDDDLMAKIVNENNYTVQLTGRKGNNITGVLEITTNFVSSNEEAPVSIPETVKKELENKVSDGIVEEKEGMERIQVMMDNRVDEFLMARVIRKWRKYKKSPKKPDCIYVDPFLSQKLKMHEEPVISEILRDCTAKHGVIFEGEKSVGKNVCATTVAWLLGMPERLMTCDRQMTPGTVFGEKTTDNSALMKIKEIDPEVLALADLFEIIQKELVADYLENVRLAACNNPDTLPETLKLLWDDFDKSCKDKIPQAVKEASKKAAEFKKAAAEAASTSIIMEDSELIDWLHDGGVFILNEMNLGDANLLAAVLNPILDGTSYLTVAGRGEVKINPDCVLIATQNPDYVGCEVQNEATLSRLSCECFEQPESILDILITAVKAQLKKDEETFGEKFEIDMKFIKQADAFYVACVKAVEGGLITNAALNIRGFVRAIVNVSEAYGYSKLRRQLEIQVVNTCPRNEREALRATLRSRVTI